MRTFGSDPEFILFDGAKPCSAIEIIKADAEHRIQHEGHEFYYDNVLAECAVKPGSSKKEVVNNFRSCLKEYNRLSSPFKLVPQASAVFAEDQLKHEDARKVGCAKDFCAYEMQQKDGPVEEISTGNLRSCGGHIHIGADILQSDGAEPVLMIYMMDLFLGVPSLWLDKDPTSPQRRSLYGHAGRYRVKPYGLEYRSLGNFWLESPEMVGLIYDLSMFCLDIVESGKAWELWKFDMDTFLESEDLADAWTCLAYDSEKLKEGINKTDKLLVESHIELVKRLLPKKLGNSVSKLIDRPVSDFNQNWS